MQQIRNSVNCILSTKVCSQLRYSSITRLSERTDVFMRSRRLEIKYRGFRQKNDRKISNILQCAFYRNVGSCIEHTTNLDIEIRKTTMEVARRVFGSFRQIFSNIQLDTFLVAASKVLRMVLFILLREGRLNNIIFSTLVPKLEAFKL